MKLYKLLYINICIIHWKIIVVSFLCVWGNSIRNNREAWYSFSCFRHMRTRHTLISAKKVGLYDVTVCSLSLVSLFYLSFVSNRIIFINFTITALWNLLLNLYVNLRYLFYVLALKLIVSIKIQKYIFYFIYVFEFSEKLLNFF